MKKWDEDGTLSIEAQEIFNDGWCEGRDKAIAEIVADMRRYAERYGVWTPELVKALADRYEKREHEGGGE